MNFLIAVGIAIAYLAVGLVFIAWMELDDGLTLFYVLTWPLLILAVIIMAIWMTLNGFCKAICKWLRKYMK